MLESADIVDELVSRLDKEAIDAEQDGIWFTRVSHSTGSNLQLRCGKSGESSLVKVFEITVREVG
jgi:hypothetical protein